MYDEIKKDRLVAIIIAMLKPVELMLLQAENRLPAALRHMSQLEQHNLLERNIIQGPTLSCGLFPSHILQNCASLSIRLFCRPKALTFFRLLMIFAISRVILAKLTARPS